MSEARNVRLRGFLLVLEAAIWVASSRMILELVPFRHIAKRLGQYMDETHCAIGAEERKSVQRVSWALGVIRLRLPGGRKCLAQAIAGKMMLYFRSVQSTLYLGIATDDDEKLLAHAWLRVGDVIVTGAEGKERFTMVGAFGEIGGLLDLRHLQS
jgi:hypothetical protein